MLGLDVIITTRIRGFVSESCSSNKKCKSVSEELTACSRSVKSEQSAKGARVMIHVNSNSGEIPMHEAIRLY
jgi:hypothetical protein